MRADYLGNRYRDFFDSLGNVTKEVQPDDTTWQYTYNGFSEVLQTTDPRGNLTTAAYDSHGNMTQFKDALGNLATNTYTSTGLLSTATDPLNHVTTYQYDSLNRQTTVTDPAGDVVTPASMPEEIARPTLTICLVDKRRCKMPSAICRARCTTPRAM